MARSGETDTVRNRVSAPEPAADRAKTKNHHCPNCRFGNRPVYAGNRSNDLDTGSRFTCERPALPI